MLQAQGGITCSPLAALASLSGVLAGGDLLWLQTAAETTQEREGRGFSSKHQRHRGRDKDRRQRPVKRKVNRDCGNRDKEAGRLG